MTDDTLGASFRDPSGFVFERDGILYRQVNRSYAADYDRLMASGLYDALVERGLLIAHEEVSIEPTGRGAPYRILRPRPLSFISYPYEWCFGELKDAALATLEIQRIALDFGMTLKDASAYNIQFDQGRPVFIDTLSFEAYAEGTPWVAWRQFCQHFLAPLALIAYRGAELGQLSRVYIDGVPLGLARSLLPRRAWLRIQLFLHIWIQAGSQRRFEGAAAADATAPKQRPVSRKNLEHLIAGLESACAGLDWKPEGTEWADYYEGDSYTDEGEQDKAAVVARHLDRIQPAEVWDLGANTGRFSRIASERGIHTVSFDVDPACVERNYRAAKVQGAPPAAARDGSRESEPRTGVGARRTQLARRAEFGRSRAGPRAGPPHRDLQQCSAGPDCALLRPARAAPGDRIRSEERSEGQDPAGDAGGCVPDLHTGGLRGGLLERLRDRGRPPREGIGSHDLLDATARLALLAESTGVRIGISTRDAGNGFLGDSR